MLRKMKILVTVLVGLSLSSFARSQSGVYKSADDFKNNRLTYEDNGANKKHLRVHDFFWSMPGITVVHNGSKINLRKSDLYGYRDDKNNVFRFYRNAAYRIVDSGKIFVYVQEKNIPLSKGFKVVNAYYFSDGPGAEVLPLTIADVAAVFAANSRFVAVLLHSYTSESVKEYDAEHNMFRINLDYLKTTGNR